MKHLAAFRTVRIQFLVRRDRTLLRFEPTKRDISRKFVCIWSMEADLESTDSDGKREVLRIWNLGISSFLLDGQKLNIFCHHSDLSDARITAATMTASSIITAPHYTHPRLPFDDTFPIFRRRVLVGWLWRPIFTILMPLVETRQKEPDFYS